MIDNSKLETFYPKERDEWRYWLTENFKIRQEIWLVFTNKGSGMKGISYNDAVEEALCFGWIDSIVRSYDNCRIQRFTPRNPKSQYSQLNRERIIWLAKNNLIHHSVLDTVQHILSEEYVFPSDIIETLKSDEQVWKNYQSFTVSYRRIRIAYIESARCRQDEFRRRLNHFVSKTRQNKQIKAYGGSEKYY